MKRTKIINLDRMRKPSAEKVVAWVPKRLSLAIGSVMLMSCADNSPQEALIYTNADECSRQYPDKVAECESAFQRSLAESEKTSPKYNSQDDCEQEFGAAKCVAQPNPSGGSWFMPMMSGFLLARALDGGGYHYNSSPLYSSTSYSSPYRGRWTTASGSDLGSFSSRRARVNPSVFKPKPAVTRTIRRGGFGSVAAAKSKWGGSSSRSSSARRGWGG